MKVTKRLFNSIVCLIVSLAVCVWAVYAWFAQNERVSSDGANTSVNSPDLEQFDITAYYLNGSGGTYTVAENGNTGDGNTYDNEPYGTLDDGDDMRPYGSLAPNATAVLFKIEYKIKDGVVN
ncbi:MAG: hypothetical protein ACI4L9_04705, partial [Candidatus Coproplasma sp.]